MAPPSLLDLIKREAGCDDDELWGVRRGGGGEAVARSREIRGRVVRPRKKTHSCLRSVLLAVPSRIPACCKQKETISECLLLPLCIYDESDALDGLPRTSLIMEKNILIDVNQCSFSDRRPQQLLRDVPGRPAGQGRGERRLPLRRLRLRLRAGGAGHGGLAQVIIIRARATL